MSLKLEALQKSPNTLYVVGTIDNVLHGNVPAQHWIDASDWAYAFEIGSTESLESLGEFLAVNGTAYCHSTETGRLLSGPRFVTTAALLVPHEAEPNFRLIYDGPPLPYSELLTAALEHLQGPFALAGQVACDPLRATAITKAPIHGECIFDNRKVYYSDPPLKRKSHAMVVGFAAPEMTSNLDLLLYQNPFEKKGSPSHTHALLLDGEMDVVHLFPDSSVVAANLHLFLTKTPLLPYSSPGE